MDKQPVTRRFFGAQMAAAGVAASAATTAAQAAPMAAFQDGPSVDHFAKLIGRVVLLENGRGETVRAELSEATALPQSRPAGFRQPFSVIFRTKGERLPQDTYVVRHRQLGAPRLLLSPVSPEDSSFNELQAVFG